MAHHSSVHVVRLVCRECLSRPNNYAPLDRGNTRQARAAAGGHTVPVGAISHGADSAAAGAVNT